MRCCFCVKTEHGRECRCRPARAKKKKQSKLLRLAIQDSKDNIQSLAHLIIYDIKQL
jgi:hypothetical protein